MVLPLPGAPPGLPGGPPPVPFDALPPQLLQPQWGLPVPVNDALPQHDSLDISVIQQRIQETVTFWQLRDSRMDEDYELWTLQGGNSEGSGEVITRNTPYVVLEKLANMLGAQTPVISVDPPQQAFQKQAQKVENLCRYLVEGWDDEHSDSLYTNLIHSIFYYLGLRGWIAGRVSFNPVAGPDDPPASLFLADPRNVYPSMGEGKLRYVVQRYQTTVGVVRDTWEEADQLFQDREDTEDVTLEAYYDDWWHCVLIDGKVVKEPTAHEYGFVPWVIEIAGGAPVRASGTTNSNAWTEFLGPSILQGMKGAYQQQNKVLSQVATSVAKAANPPAFYFYDPVEGEPKQLDMSAGAQNFLVFDRERVDIIKDSPNPADASAILNAMNEDIQKATLPPVLWGGTPGDQSGFAVALLSGAARDSTFGMVRAAEKFIRRSLTYSLHLIHDFAQGAVGFVVRDPSGNWIGGDTVTPEEIGQVGFRKIRVKFRDVAPKDQFQLAQLAALLVDKMLVSPESAMDKYLGIENPQEEIDKILKSLVYKDEELVKNVLNPRSLYYNDPELFQAWAFWTHFKNTMGGGGQNGGGSPAPALPPGPPGGGPPPGAQPLPGTPPTLAPAPMSGSPNFDALRQALASALGGAGQQRQPGVSGLSGQIPGGLGVR